MVSVATQKVHRQSTWRICHDGLQSTVLTMKSQPQPTTIQRIGSPPVPSSMTDDMEIALHPMHPAGTMGNAMDQHIMELLTVCTGTT